MSGHSKWSQIKHKKGVVDARKGQAFTKIAREISVAAREGGPDPNGNVRLRLAFEKAKEANMPHENVERAIKRASGPGDGSATISRATYEGYSPGGAAVLVEVLTDNRNRAVSEVRAVFTRAGGNLGETGCVSWVFENKGVLTVEGVDSKKADEAALAAIDAGADDFRQDGDFLEVYCDPGRMDAVRRALQEQGVEVARAEISMVPKSTAPLGVHEAEQTLRLLDRLEELDDVQKVYTNADFPEAALERYRVAAS